MSIHHLLSSKQVSRADFNDRLQQTITPYFLSILISFASLNYFRLTALLSNAVFPAVLHRTFCHVATFHDALTSPSGLFS